MTVNRFIHLARRDVNRRLWNAIHRGRGASNHEQLAVGTNGAMMLERGIRTAIMTLAFAVLVGCGSTSTTAPSSPTQPPPDVSFVNMAGQWTGTLETANLETRSITMTIVQDAACVDGVWSSTPPGWSGAISGYAAADSFSGQVSMEIITDAGERCTGVGDTSGPVDAANIRLTSAGTFSVVVKCNTVLARSLVLTLHRK